MLKYTFLTDAFYQDKDYLIRQRFQAYMRAYIKAKSRLDVPRNKTLVQMSTLQYFEEYLS